MQGVVAQFGRALNVLSSTEDRIIATAFVVIGAALLVGLVAPYLLRRLAALVGRTADHRAADGPLAVVLEELPFAAAAVVVLRAAQLLLIVAGGLALLVVWGQIPLALAVLVALDQVVPTVTQVALTVALLAGGYFGADVLEDVVEEVTAASDRVSEHEQHVVYRLAQLGLVAAVVLGGLLVWQINPAGLFVGAGFLGIVFGLAARQTLGSLVAGFVLMFSRPFEIGDWVEIGDTEGIVTDITVINTRLRNFSGEHVSIPNDRVGDSVVHNRTKEGRLRLEVEVGIDYEADPEHAATVAVDAIRRVDAVVDNPGPVAVPTTFADSAVVLDLRFWIQNPSPPRKWRAVRGVVTEVRTAFADEDIGIPFPQQTLSTRPNGLDIRSLSVDPGEQ